MEKITFIVPVHEFNNNVQTLLIKAISSVNAFKEPDNTEFSFIGPKEVIENVKNVVTEDVTRLHCNYYNLEETDVYKLINQAAKWCLTTYFSVLEFDDTYNDFWLKEFNLYSKENSDASIYMPIVELYDTDGKFGGFVNEIAWATSFSADELGYLDLECLKSFMDFNVTGAIINTEDFISVGCLKPTLKIAAWYEFLMRVANNQKNIYVVPKAGYNHMVGRKDSYMKKMTAEIDADYGRWLIKKAQEEYTFSEERELEYNPQVEDTKTEE